MTSGAGERVAVCIVTYGSAADLQPCFATLAQQDHRPLDLVVVDCASTDGSAEVARQTDVPGVRKQVVALNENLGFAGGMNTAFRHTEADYLLTLNADTRPQPDFIRRLLERLLTTPRCGAVTGRLVRSETSPGQRVIDACGMRLTPTWRHLDRGSGEPDTGQWNEAQEVFGATGAATLFAREALEDVAFEEPEGEIFDTWFHSFREDAELCFRLQERGWRVIYEPAGVAEHRRRVLPERRSQLPSAINRNSLKNRYLLRAYHQTRGNFWRTLLPTAFRDLQALVYVLLFERTSLSAYTWLWRHRRQILERRRVLQQRRTRPPETVDRWFRTDGLPL
ncbi:MAG: glycosyltransferase family 2 protein [Acidobacteriota bacterium]